MADASADDKGSKREGWRADKVSTSRAMVFYTIGLLIGLILGGIGLFSARGTTTNTVPPENLATVNNRPILRSDFVAQLELETGVPMDQTTREDQLRVLDEMIREELFVQRGLELDFAETDQDTRNALYTIVEQQVLAGVNLSQASEKELMAYFEAHRADFASEGAEVKYEDVADKVKSAHFHSEKLRVMNNMMDFLRNRSTILIADDYKDDYKPQEFRDVF